jgi:hypothetical protein
VCFSRFKNETMGTVIIHTIYTEAKQIKSMKGEKIHELLNFFLTGLRKRSRYLLAVLDRSQTGRMLFVLYTGCIKKSKTILKLLSIPQFCS